MHCPRKARWGGEHSRGTTGLVLALSEPATQEPWTSLHPCALTALTVEGTPTSPHSHVPRALTVRGTPTSLHPCALTASLHGRTFSSPAKRHLGVRGMPRVASSLAASGPSVVTSPSVSFMGHPERLLGFFSSSKVSSSGQRFRTLVFVPVVLLGAPLEPGWGQWGWNRLGARLRWFWGLRGAALPGGSMLRASSSGPN